VVKRITVMFAMILIGLGVGIGAWFTAGESQSSSRDGRDWRSGDVGTR